MIRKLRAIHFRNFEDLTLDLHPSLNVFIGENGQGKSNLVEALCLLSTGDSFREFENSILIQTGHKEAALIGHIRTQDLLFTSRVLIQPKSRSFFVNDKKTTTSRLNQIFKLVVFSPDSLDAIKGSADQRRRLIDEIAQSFYPTESKVFSEFKKALASRNKILKALTEAPADRSLLDQLESLNPLYLRLATELVGLRLQVLRTLEQPHNYAFNQFGRNAEGSAHEISSEYVISGTNVSGFSNREIHSSMQKRLEELRVAEVSSGVSLVGPQRHEIKFLFNGNDSRFFCSQGQQRALIIALKLAQIMYHRQSFGQYPILVLDDVLSELDERKRGDLVGYLTKIETQVFVTATDLNLAGGFQDQEGQMLRVRSGTVGQI